MALAKWYKVDFHTHTPESKCFPDKSVTAEQWLAAAKQSGLNAVVITDHNSVGFISKIDEVKENYEDNNFKVFYGIELCVSAEFTHILIVFNDTLTVTQIEDAIISDLGLKRDNWTNTEVSVSEEQLKKLCHEMRDNIFVIPAHFASEKGLAKAKTIAIKQYQEFVQFDAVEVRNDHDVEEYNNKLANKAINQTVLITGSDNPSDRDEAEHSIEGFGKKFTWMKMSAISFEGIRQVFIDPEHRCINWLQAQKIGIDFNPNEVGYNYISGIKMNGIKHMSDNMSMRFSPSLNCIVGGRGTGKSTIVDAINYGLDTSLDISKCTLLNKTVERNGKIQTFFEFGTNKSYRIETSRSGKTLVHTCYDDDGVVDNPPEFKIDFYGQKEIFALIEEDDNVVDTGVSPLVKMIDSKINTKLYGVFDEIETALLEMIRLADDFKNNRRKIRELPTIKAEIAKSEAVMRKFKASGLELARRQYDAVVVRFNDCKKEVMAHNFYYENLAKDLPIKIGGVDNMIAMLKAKGDDSSVQIMQKIRQSYVSFLEVVIRQQKLASTIETDFDSSSIATELQEKKDVYNDALVEVQNTGSENIEEIQDRLQECKQREKELLEIQGKQNEIQEAIKDKIDCFVESRLKLTEQRRQIINALELDNIRISILPLAHKSRWRQVLQKEVGKEGTFDNDFQKFVNSVLISEDMEQYKKFLYFLLTTEDGDISEFTTENYDPRFCKLWESKLKNDTLSSLVKVIPEDYISIKIIEESTEIDINEGSPGQKSAAVLAFILSSGDNPLIIDQPEDDLDNSLIYSLVVKSIRKMKSRRQIIIVTHNPNIPVLGDAEGIIILERNTDGKVIFRKSKKAGCIEEKLIREGICDIMEGGKDAFRKREQKYLYSK